MKIITVASLKGGVGKTTLAIYLGAYLATTKKKVLLIDADPNNNMTDFFLREEPIASLREKNLYRVLNGESELTESIWKLSENLSILATTPELAKAHLELSNDPGSMIRFSKDIKNLDFDFIVWDTPPSLTYELFLALNESNIVLCPVGFSRWTFQGYELILQATKRAKVSDPYCVPFNVSKKDAERVLEADLPKITKSFIPKSTAFNKSAIKGNLIKDGDPLWNEFRNLTKEIL